ncbi:MAG: hypothetical protein ACI8PZ_006228, partial [Myxococcota bacterium]
AWADARAHRIRSRDWLRARRPPVARALARCWARSALTGDPVVAASLLERARSWDLRPEVVWTAGATVADALEVLGAEAWGVDWEAAFVAYDAAARADPRRAWARRWAEQARPRRW